MKEFRQRLVEGFPKEWRQEYRIEDVVMPWALEIIRDAANPKATLCKLLNITGNHPGQADGIWIVEGKDITQYCGGEFPALYLVAKPHTGWY